MSAQANQPTRLANITKQPYELLNETLISKYVGDYITEGILSEVKKGNDGLYYWIDGMSSEPTNSSLTKNVAHPYLFKGNFTKAIELYQQYLKSNETEKELMEDLKNDFEYFSKAGFDNTFIKRRKKNFHFKIPK